MKLAMRLATAGDETDDQVAFHRSAGVDEFVAPDAPTDADWVIDAEPGEFWWPRAESLKEVLAPIPPRYTIVQALVREFDGKQLTRRSTVEGMRAAGRTLLRPVRRRGFETRAVPLRAWYPLEVFRIEPSVPSQDLVEDTRLRDALNAIGAGGSVAFRTPDIVDDAAYAVECAAVGEVDLPSLEAYVAELEQRVAWLEQRFWPRVLRQLKRFAQR